MSAYCFYWKHVALFVLAAGSRSSNVMSNRCLKPKKEGM